jgi:maleylacetoacetate isomerase
LATDQQLAPSFKAINPQASVPALLVDNGEPLTQSLAILEYLDEVHPDPPLLPSDPRGRARVRSLARLFAADHHPLITPRVNRYLADQFGAYNAACTAWIRYWLRQSLDQAEARIAGNPATGRFCHGSTPTIADLCLASQLLGAKGFAVETADLPTVNRIGEFSFKLEAFARAHPLRQPGA